MKVSIMLTAADEDEQRSVLIAAKKSGSVIQKDPEAKAVLFTSFGDLRAAEVELERLGTAAADSVVAALREMP